jgi:ABC-2 type transport system permease protein
MPLAGLGALIGASSRRIEEAVLFSQLLMLALVAMGPVLVPPDQLPQIVVVLGRLNPATYAVSALGQVLIGPVSGQLAWDVAFLLAFTLGSLWLVSRLMDWRQK